MERTVQGTIVKDHHQDQDKEEIAKGITEEDQILGIIKVEIMKMGEEEEIGMRVMIGEMVVSIEVEEMIVMRDTVETDKIWIIKMEKGMQGSIAIKVLIPKVHEDQGIGKTQKEKGIMNPTQTMTAIEAHMIAGGNLELTILMREVTLHKVTGESLSINRLMIVTDQDLR